MIARGAKRTATTVTSVEPTVSFPLVQPGSNSSRVIRLSRCAISIPDLRGPPKRSVGVRSTDNVAHTFTGNNGYEMRRRRRKARGAHVFPWPGSAGEESTGSHMRGGIRSRSDTAPLFAWSERARFLIHIHRDRMSGTPSV